MISDNFINFKQKYDELKSAQKVADYYGCSKQTVLNYAKSIGYDNSNNKIIKIKPEDFTDIYEKYMSGETINNLAK